jgi:alpha-D-xyloside xylohydrolase
VKSGAIIPAYPDDERTNTPDSPLKIYIFTGSDGRFELYKDDGESFGYKRNKFAYIPFSWDDKNSELVIDAQIGDYNKGKVQEFQIVLVEGQQKDIRSIPVKKHLQYSGSRQKVNLRASSPKTPE